ncbi:FecCD family ABC transporter permease [Nocardiopsis kunsanensis]|uniref:FecCD family ABC transporter permease n=1 Tax=Nocardiopsis kunsanensis TaxID=141693 RepID=UPI000344DA91
MSRQTTLASRTQQAQPAPEAEYGPPPGVLVLRLGRVGALPIRHRSLTVWLLITAAVLGASAVTLTIGDLGISLTQLPSLLTGGGEATDRFVLSRLRGPRLLVGVGVGAALGVAGALFQAVTRNPLGSPDVIGLGAGAGAGASVAALIAPGAVPVPLGALLGAGIAIGLVTLSTGTGLRHPGRIIVAGIGVSAMAQAFTHFVVAFIARDEATSLATYLNGSLTARDWGHAGIIWGALLFCLPVLLYLAGPVRLGEMGDETSQTLGAPARTTRTVAVLMSVLLSAAAVSVAGPISFVALTAPQIARRMAGAGGPSLVLSAAVGALLIVCADLVVQRVPLGEGLPVGIVTMALGGIYLGHLLIREWRKGTL